MTEAVLPGAYRIDANADEPFRDRFDEVVNAVRRCDLTQGTEVARTIIREVEALGPGLGADERNKALGRAHSFLGEIAGMAGDFKGLVFEFNAALSHFGRTTIPGSMSRSYRGFAQAYFMNAFPGYAHTYAQKAFLFVPHIDREWTQQRADYECNVMIALPLAALGRLAEAEKHARAADEMRDRTRDAMSSDEWLPGLADLVGGQVAVARGRSTGSEETVESGIARLRLAVDHYERARLPYWLAISREMLAKAVEDVDRGAAFEAVMAALETYEAMGARHHVETAKRFARRVDPVRPSAGATKAKPSRPSIKPDEMLVELRDGNSILVAGPRTRETVLIAARYAQDEQSAIIYGETGSGKEALARLMHDRGPRARGPFVEFNCATADRNLIASELFGHEKGAFTGASSSKRGRFEAANNGTLFIDEVGELPLELQPMLLKAVEEKKISRLGENEKRAINVRIICATNRNLEQMAAENAFRSDLFYRLSILPLCPYPLRERLDEVYHLAQFFAERRGFEIENEAVEALMRHTWPGNVRELKNVIDRASALAREREETSFTAEIVRDALVGGWGGRGGTAQLASAAEVLEPSRTYSADPPPPGARTAELGSSQANEEVDFDPARTTEMAALDPGSRAEAIDSVADAGADPGPPEVEASEPSEPSVPEDVAPDEEAPDDEAPEDDAPAAAAPDDVPVEIESPASLTTETGVSSADDALEVAGEPATAPSNEERAPETKAARTGADEGAAEEDGACSNHEGDAVTPDSGATPRCPVEIPAAVVANLRTTLSGLGVAERAIEETLGAMSARVGARDDYVGEALGAAARLAADRPFAVRAGIVEDFERVQRVFGTETALALVPSRVREAPRLPTGLDFLEVALDEEGELDVRLAEALPDAIRNFQRYFIVRALKIARGNRTQTAKLLGLNRPDTRGQKPYSGLQSLQSKIRGLGIEFEGDEVSPEAAPQRRNE